MPQRANANKYTNNQRSRRLRVGVLTAVLATAMAVPLAGPALAGSSSADGCQDVAGLSLLGASPAGLAVRQSAVLNAQGQTGSPVLTGAIGAQLTARPLLDPTVTSGPRTMLTVVGQNLAWYEYLQRAGSRPKAIHRMNVLTGADIVDGEMPQPGAFNGDWFTDAVPSFAPYPWQWQRPLLLYRTGDGFAVPEVLIPNVPGVEGVSMAADKTRVLRATTEYVPDALPHYYLDLVKLGNGAITRLLGTTEVISKVALTSHTVVWVSTAADGSVKINQRRRVGGAISSYTETNPNADVVHLVAGNRKVGYLVPDPSNPAGTVLRIVTGTTSQQVALPLGGSGLAAVGSRFYTATGGPASVAGVYRVAGSRVRRVATVPCTP
jgi:hypothetical protein